METIRDEVFGTLEFERYWSREIDVTFLDTRANVQLIVEGNDKQNSIWDEQRLAFQQLADAIPRAEAGIFDFYQSICDDYRSQFGDDADNRMPRIASKSELSRLVKLTGLVFPIVMSRGERSVGFLLECSWEPEHGLGVKITNGRIEVGSQDILT